MNSRSKPGRSVSRILAVLGTCCVAGALLVFAVCSACADPIFEFRIEHPNALDQTHSLGYACARDGDTLVVGAFSPGQYVPGLACVYRRDGEGQWLRETDLKASDAQAGTDFGYSVAISADTAVVGAMKDSTKGYQCGAAYVFVRNGATWTQQAKIYAADPGAEDWFGWCVAIVGDTAMISANRDDNAAGAVYVFTRSGSAWTQQAKLSASDAATGDRFGEALALSSDLLFVGANLDDVGSATNAGSVYVFARSGSAWGEQCRLSASDGEVGDLFGTAVALSEDNQTLIVGSRYDDAGASDSGSAYVFCRDGSAWVESAKLVPSDPGYANHFGYRVAISGGTVLVGASDSDEAGWASGSAYVFVGGGSTWVQQAKLTASDANYNDGFGVSVLVSGDEALIGGAYACGVYVFTRNTSTSTWAEQAKLLRLDTDFVEYDQFGLSVAMSGNTLIVGSPMDNTVREGSGSAYVFTRNGTNWTEQAQLSAPDVPRYGDFGWSVAAWDNTAIVGAPGDNFGTAASDSGSVYVFTRRGGAWGLQAKILPPVPATDDRFGGAVAVHGNTVVIGAHCSVSHRAPGSAYVFAKTGSAWNLVAALNASDAAIGDKFGASVAITGDYIVIGAPRRDAPGLTDCGAVYVFKRSGSQWTEQAKIVPSDAAAEAHFGSSVSISGNAIAVGAYPDDGAGAVYLFSHSGAGWGGEVKLVSPNAVGGDCFGRCAALSGNKLVVGATAGGGWVSGQAYIFTRTGGVWDSGVQFVPASRTDSGDRFGTCVAMSGGRVILGAPDTENAEWDSGAAYAFRLAPSVVFETDETPEAMLTGDIAQIVNEDTTLTPVGVTVPNGSQFVEWQTSDGAFFSSSNPVTPSGLESDATLIAVFGPAEMGVPDWTLYE